MIVNRNSYSAAMIETEENGYSIVMPETDRKWL